MRFGVCPVRDALPLLGGAAGRFTRSAPMRSRVNNSNCRFFPCNSLLLCPKSNKMASSLASSVSSLQSSLQLLDNSINTLDAGVNDFPRLCKVLQTTRVRSPEEYLIVKCQYLCTDKSTAL